MSYNSEINLHYVHDKNAGDIFAKFLLEKLIDAKINKASLWNSNNIFQLTGSIASDSNERTIILGTGVITKNRTVNKLQECYLVRGTHTLEKVKPLVNNYDSIKMGDTGILLEKLVNVNVTPKYDYGLILHYVDAKYAPTILTPECKNKVLIIDILNDNLPDIAEKILSCRKIISSTLHGMVFAHSLGVPVSWIRLRYTILTPDDIKFYDYLSALNITGENLCNIVPNKDISLKDLQNLKCIDVDKTVMKNKKHELLTCLVGVFRKFGYKIKPEFDSY
nr:hypothetical protein [Megavirus caiporensis]